MKIKEMIGALQINKKKAENNKLSTDFKVGLTEYPRPSLVRDNYLVLNGEWNYAFTESVNKPATFEGKILVPFSPETELSGVERQLQPNEVLWYERSLVINEKPENKRLILHFGAVDERCIVYINDKEVGRHRGGYLAFSIDITKEIKEGENILTLMVIDKSDTSYHSRGKQMLKNGGMFYTAQSGIWQTVWMEWVPDTYVTYLKVTPLFDSDEVLIEIETNKKNPMTVLEAQVFDGEKEICSAGGKGYTSLTLTIPHKKCWSPVSPFLYNLKIKYGEDEFKSYFGMRKLSVKKDEDGIPRLCLNNVPYFQNGVLDQGYYPESLLTPPSDEAMINDIIKAKELGFNMIRKHCKIEPERWYYHCDRLGMLVWQDMVNGGETYNLLLSSYLPTVFRFLRKAPDKLYGYMCRNNPKGRAEWKRECKETIELLYNHPSICTWVLFNEGWGQFDAKKNTKLARSLDSTRFIDAHSGWFDQNAGDMKSEHIYFFDLFIRKTDKPYVISEYGGLACPTYNHMYSSNAFGYETHKSRESFCKAYDKMHRDIEALVPKGLCAAVYTQLTDIEEEINGLMSYDRKVVKK